MESRKCEKCNSDKIIENIKITDLGHGNARTNLSIYLKKTNRVLFYDYTKSELSANICGNCGNVELSINNPNELWDTYRKNKEE